MEFQNKIVLITGGSSGIGLALAKGLSEKGAHVWLVARRKEKLEEALQQVRAVQQDSRQNFGIFSADVSDFAQASAAVDYVTKKAGLPDLVINSAGVTEPGLFDKMDLELFHWMMDINFYGTLNMVKSVVPGMLERHSGYIANISSVLGFLGVFGYTAYASSKFAVRGLTDSLRSELKPRGIRMSIIYPPDTDTPQLEYDIQHRPPELDTADQAFSKVDSPEVVAKRILNGIARNHYVILPGFTPKWMYYVSSIAATATYPILDFLFTQSNRKNGHDHNNHENAH